jgi:GDP-L-fucose synthase
MGKKINKNSKIYIAGHSGMVGSAIYRKFEDLGYLNIIVRDHDDLDLTVQIDVENFFSNEKPEIVILTAAKVGGIKANNKYRADFIYENLAIENNVIHAAYKHKVRKLIFFGSSCIYPCNSKQPIKEEYLLQGPFEPTNEPFAVAKVAGIKLCEGYYKQYGSNYFSIIPANIFGPNDEYNLENSHVLSALILKFHNAIKKNSESVTLWGTGKPLREFIYVDDIADACVFLLEKVNAKDIYDQNISHLNIGSGEEISIFELAKLVAKVVGYDGNINFDTSKPDGMPRKLLDSGRINNLGWDSKTSIQDGVRLSYDWCLNNDQILDWV